MAHHLVRNLSYTAIAAALALQGCGKSSEARLDRSSSWVAGSAPTVRPSASGFDAAHKTSRPERLPVARAPPIGQGRTEDPPSWLAELLRAPDPNVRIQGLDAWARQPTVSLDPVTNALVDPDESVRTRAQELLEQELARR
jgi:hypothetical protein